MVELDLVLLALALITFASCLCAMVIILKRAAVRIFTEAFSAALDGIARDIR